MTFEQALEKINSHEKFGWKLGLERITKILELMGNPQKSLKFVHVAGTNGKGSICAMLSSILTASGLKVGTHPSPHLVDIRERFRINDAIIAKEKFTKLTEKIMPFIDIMHKSYKGITYFELMAAMAFLYFNDENCDVVVLETGLGGRLDATNVIDAPLLCVISSISLDHTDRLGGTLTEISHEKAGIIKNPSPVVISPNQKSEALDVFKKVALEKGCKLVASSLNKVNNVKFDLHNGTNFEYSNLSLKMPLIGHHQVENAVAVLESVNILKNHFKITDENIVKGLENVRHNARFQVISKSPTIILDGSHNPMGAKALAKTLEICVKNKKILAIAGMCKDKNIDETLSHVLPMCSGVITTAVNYERAAPTHELAKIASKYNKNVRSENNSSAAVKRALTLADDNTVIVIFGSLYLAGEILLKQIFD